MDVLAVASDVGRAAAQLTAEEGATALFQVNLFWVIVSALNFIVFFVIIWTFAFKPVSAMLATGSSRGSRTPNRHAPTVRMPRRSESRRSPRHARKPTTS